MLKWSYNDDSGHWPESHLMLPPIIMMMTIMQWPLQESKLLLHLQQAFHLPIGDSHLIEIQGNSFLLKTSFSSIRTPPSLNTAINSSTCEVERLGLVFSPGNLWCQIQDVLYRNAAFSFLASHSETLDALPEKKSHPLFHHFDLLPGFLRLLVFHCRKRRHYDSSFNSEIDNRFLNIT